jgi:hypothetical protein
MSKEKLINMITEEIVDMNFDTTKKYKKIKITVGKKRRKECDELILEETAKVPEVDSVEDAQYELAKAYRIILQLDKEVQRLGALAGAPGMSWKQCLDHIDAVNLAGKGDMHKKK